ncbi:MAG: hypothetical protein IPH44_33660 [Myxococcales bacterium]|nr:hypothetical protein [Myxococcales bacterium]
MELADVDAIIARCFGTNDLKVVHDPVQAGDVPREFLECALAAAVLVAHADGELSDDELTLLEHVFASEISDWQAYSTPLRDDALPRDRDGAGAERARARPHALEPAVRGDAVGR